MADFAGTLVKNIGSVKYCATMLEPLDATYPSFRKPDEMAVMPKRTIRSIIVDDRVILITPLGGILAQNI